MKLLFVGDTVLTQNINYSDYFNHLCSQHDYCIANLEGCFSQTKKGILKAGPHVIMNEEYLADFAKIFTHTTLANNHTMDCGEEGYIYTTSLLRQNDINYCGIGNNIEEAFQSTIIDNIAIISIAEHEFGGADIDKIGIATTDKELWLYKEIQKQKKDNKIVILCYHGGSEIIPIPPKYLRERCRLYIEYGVDIIIGNHPHVVQGFEYYNNKPIFYSLGNFFFKSADFSIYKNSDWSLAISIDITIGNIEIYYLSSINNTIDIDVTKNEEFNKLCDYIQSPYYNELHKNISYHLYRHWYPELQGNGSHASYILHHLRCDAHRNAVCTGLSINMGEIPIKNTPLSLINSTGDSIEIITNNLNEN